MSGPLWTFDELVEAMGGRPTGPLPGPIGGISIDSRSLTPGDAFFAIRGDRFDGHDFVGRAYAAGASTAVIAEARIPALGRITGSKVVVEDVLEALRGLARAARERTAARVVAVTGSAGKTTTKEMLRRVLGAQAPTHGSAASHNNHWGVPLTLARLPKESAYAVFEIGMNHAGEILPLTRLVQPRVAVITNVEPVHLAHFDGLEGIARAKAEIFAGVERGGIAVLNRDNGQFDLLRRLAAEAGIKTIASFGEHPDADARLDEAVLSSDQSMVAAHVVGQELTYTIGAPGGHLVMNSLAVLAAVAALGADLARAAADLAGFEPPAGRGRRRTLALPQGEVALIDESYNANPASMAAAIGVLGRAEASGGEGRRIAVLGDMLELGETEHALHAGLAEPLFSAGIDCVFLAGPRMAALWEILPDSLKGAYAASADELLPILSESVAAGDVIMVKGSNASGMGRVVEALLAAGGADERGGRGRI